MSILVFKYKATCILSVKAYGLLASGWLRKWWALCAHLGASKFCGGWCEVVTVKQIRQIRWSVEEDQRLSPSHKKKLPDGYSSWLSDYWGGGPVAGEVAGLSPSGRSSGDDATKHMASHQNDFWTNLGCDGSQKGFPESSVPSIKGPLQKSKLFQAIK